MDAPDRKLEDVVLTRVLHLNASIQGLVMGSMLGVTVFVATNWLVLKGGPVVGPHLQLLSQFFFGYRVTFVGSLIGFAYAFVCGFIGGYLLATTYNVIARRRDAHRADIRR